MSENDHCGGGSERSTWRIDGWKYTGQETGIHQTRHDAIGAETVATRRARERYGEIRAPPVLAAIQHVFAFKPYYCGYCSETFLTEPDRDDHQPCPARENEWRFGDIDHDLQTLDYPESVFWEGG